MQADNRQLSVHVTEQGLKKHFLKASETRQVYGPRHLNMPSESGCLLFEHFQFIFKDHICGDALTEMYSNVGTIIFFPL